MGTKILNNELYSEEAAKGFLERQKTRADIFRKVEKRAEFKGRDAKLRFMLPDGITEGEQVYSVLLPEWTNRMILLELVCDVAEKALSYAEKPDASLISAVEKKRGFLNCECSESEAEEAHEKAWKAYGRAAEDLKRAKTAFAAALAALYASAPGNEDTFPMGGVEAAARLALDAAYFSAEAADNANLPAKEALAAKDAQEKWFEDRLLSYLVKRYGR
jgi:hypothetical protein